MPSLLSAPKLARLVFQDATPSAQATAPAFQATAPAFQATDEGLMARFREGDSAALAFLFDRYAGRVEALILKSTGDAALARDITQTTFLSVVRGRARYVDGCRFRPWLFTIAMNALRDHLRRSKREVLVADSSAVAQAEPHVDQYRDGALAHRLQQALDQLPFEQRQAVVLHQLEDASFAEIAAIVGCSRSAAKVRAHRGYRRLRVLLGHVNGEVP